MAGVRVELTVVIMVNSALFMLVWVIVVVVRNARVYV